MTEMRLQKRPRQQQQPLDSEFFWTSGFINNQVANRKSIVLKHRDHKISDPKPPLSQSSSKKEWFGLARLGLLGESFADRYPRRQESRPNGLCLLHRSLKVPVVFEGPDTEQSQSSQVSQSSSVSIAMGRVVGKSQIFLHRDGSIKMMQPGLMKQARSFFNSTGKARLLDGNARSPAVALRNTDGNGSLSS